MKKNPANLCWKYYSAVIFAVKLENKKISKPLLEFFFEQRKVMKSHEKISWGGTRH